MPNWTNTRMSVIGGTEKEIRDFVSKIQVIEGETESMFANKITKIYESLIPCPAELFEVTSPVRENQAELAKEMMEKHGATDWYQWQYDNWGVKWGDCHTFMEEEPHQFQNGNWEVVYIYDLPWGDGEPAHQNISRLFPNLRFGFDFDEEAGFFQGCQVMKAGEILFSEFFEPCNWEEPLPKDATDEQEEAYWEKHSEWRGDKMHAICKKADKVGWA